MNKRFLWLLPVRSVLFFLSFVAGSFILGKKVSEISNLWTIVAVTVNVLVIFLLILAAKKNDTTFDGLLTYEKGKTKAPKVILMIFVTLTVGMTGMYLAGFLCYGVIPYMAPMMVEPVPKTLAIINVLLLPVTTALAEDGLYLGIGVNQIKNKWLSVLVPAFFFALQHCFIPTLFDMRYVIYRFLSFLPLTLVYTFHYRKHRDPLPIMIGHAAIDLLTALTSLAASFAPGLFDF